MTKTPPTIPIEIASRNTPSSFICCKCAITQADFFVTNGSLENPTEVVPLCFQCYVHKRKWKWRVVKEKKGKQHCTYFFRYRWNCPHSYNRYKVEGARVMTAPDVASNISFSSVTLREALTLRGLRVRNHYLSLRLDILFLTKAKKKSINVKMNVVISLYYRLSENKLFITSRYIAIQQYSPVKIRK